MAPARLGAPAGEPWPHRTGTDNIDVEAFVRGTPVHVVRG